MVTAAVPVSRVQQFELAVEASPVDHEIIRSLPLPFDHHIWRRENKELRQCVKKPINATHIETIIFLTSVESASVPISERTASWCGPLVKGKECIMNLCSL